MWPWQRNGEQPSYTLIRRLIVLSSVGHFCMLLLLFVFYHGDATNVSRDVIAVLLDMDVTVVQVPLTKVINKKVPVIGAGKKSAAQAPAKKEAPPATGLAKPKVAIAKAKKEIPKTKPQQKAKEIPKPKEPEPPKVVKVEPKKVEIEQPVVEEKVAQIDPEIVQAVDVQGENVVYVGLHEYEALEVQRQIQQEAQRCWKTPPGVAADVSCQIIVHVDRTGKICDINIAEKSGILMYDVSARQAVYQMEFPRGSWGKEVVVYFKQS